MSPLPRMLPSRRMREGFFMTNTSGDRRGLPPGALWPLLFLALVLAPTLAAARPPDPEQVQAQARAAVELRRQTQQAVDRFAQEESQLQDRMETLQGELKITERRLAKTRAYLDDQEKKVAELERRLAEIERIRAGLEPFLDDTCQRLGAFVEQDLKFLGQERRDRLQAVDQVLNDYQAGLAAKARAVLDALGAEAGYGSSVGVREAELTIAGGVRRVRLLRLGRLALFALDLEGEVAWRWDGKSQSFLPLADAGSELAKAAEMAQRQRVASLVQIPLGPLPAGEKKP